MNKNKLMTVSFLAISVVLLTSIYIFAQNNDKLLQEQTVSFYEKQSKMLTGLVEKSLYEQQNDTQLQPLIMGPVNENNLIDIISTESFKTKLNTLTTQQDKYIKIAILDLQGKVLVETTKNKLSANVPKFNVDQLTIANSEWFKAIRNNQVNRIQQADLFGPQQQFIDNYPDRYDLLIGHPIFAENGDKIAIWINIIDFSLIEDIFKNTYQQLALNDLHHLELALIDDQGYLLIDYDPISKHQNSYQRDFSILNQVNLIDAGVKGADRAIAGFSGVELTSHETKDVEQIIIYNHFSGHKQRPNIGWSTIIRIDQQDAFSVSQLFDKNIYQTLIISFLLLLTLGYLIYKQLLIPLNNLTHSIKNLSTNPISKHRLTNVDHETHIIIDDLEQKFIDNQKLVDKNKIQQEILDLQRSAIDSTKTGIVVTDIRLPDQPIIFINKAFSDISGYSAEEVLGKNCRFLQGPNTEKALIKQMSHAITKGKPCDVVITNYNKAGREFINNLSLGPVFNKNNQLTHYIGVQNDITEEKQKEEASMVEMALILEERTKESKDSANRLRAVFDTTFDGTIVLDERGNIKDVNRSLELIFGRTRTELIDYNISILLVSLQYNQQDQLHKSPFKDWLRNYIGQTQKIYGLHKSGHQVPLEFSVGETILEAETMYVAILRDISVQEQTKRRELELQKQLHDQELIYRTAFDQAAVGIARVGTDSNFLEVNTKMCEILGYEESALLTKKIKDVTYEEDIPQSFQYIKELLENKKSFFTTDKRYIRADGIVFWANLSVSLVREDVTQQPLFFIAVVEDISERIASADALLLANDERDKLLCGINLASEAAGVCNWSYDLQTGELNWDSRTCQLYGVDENQAIVYKDWRNGVHPDDVEIAEQEVADAIENICSIKTEFRVINKVDKSIRWVQCSADLLLDENQKPVIMYGINIDLTHEKTILLALEKESQAAKQASKSKSRFLATMSHEIRTPMNGVIGMIDLLKNTPLNSDQKRMVTTIRDSSFSLLDIINDILDFSKIESGQIEIDLTPCNVLSIVEKTMDSLWINASNKNVELYIDPDLSMPKELMLDTVRVRQILLNLLGNAIKFSGGKEDKGKVTVKTQFEENLLSLEVIDNGVGISTEQQQKLFVPFSQADSSTTRKFGGTGLGLSITKSFTELMKGDIQINSELGEGSSFKVVLPVQAESSKEVEFEQFDFSMYAVFIACSNDDLANSCHTILAQLKHHNIHVISIDDCYLVTQSSMPAVLLTDTEQFKCSDECKQVKTLQLNSDPIERKGHIDPYTYVVGTHPLKPTELIFGLAVLCGLESPILDWSTEDNQSNKAVVPQTIAEAELNNTLILVAEDQPTNRLVLGKQLDSLGYAYEMSEDGVIALELWKTGRFSLLLTDWHMPNMDGLELTRTIRDIENLENKTPTIIIAVTANAMVGESDNCIDAGMNDYIAKPIEISTLKEKLAKYLDINSQESILTADSNLPTQEFTQSVIDFSQLEAVIGTNDKDITDEILAMFWSSVVDDFELIKQGLENRDPETIRSRGHAAKGASVSSGAISLGELFKWIEKNNDNFEGIVTHINDIEAELVLIKRVLETRSVL
ncbi:PAS domain S-box protein [Shewanella electrodiphila]|uniref:histidine kinase n=1 Tax=Shewanella electrodiphila TaxID=934143 RepID=A0ABT0KMH2_9GAMM|nr:PAS domain S-box protein [Shewanella electrodiphila]MCL1044948.1 PAS domain S-box protein [Shewanella electrodiphila]